MCRIMCKERNARFFAPSNDLLTDNAAMIAYLGEIMFKSGIKERNIDKVDIMPRQRTDDVEVRWKVLNILINWENWDRKSLISKSFSHQTFNFINWNLKKILNWNKTIFFSRHCLISFMNFIEIYFSLSIMIIIYA